MAELWFEIGCEEIPARMLARALADAPAMVQKSLASERLAFTAVHVIGTPRRLAFVIEGLALAQPDLHETVVGPPVNIAFGADGALSKAGLGFANKAGVDPATVTRGPADGKKGEYALAAKFIAGQPTLGLLPALLTSWVAGLPWPKSMRWGWAEERFVRPVQWLVALFDGEVVPLQWRGMSAGRTTRGHRFLSTGNVELVGRGGLSAYVAAMRAAHVLVDPVERRAHVQAELARVAAASGVVVRQDEALLDEVMHLAEYPIGLVGEFAARYLAVPAEIIVTAMRAHQRYFAVEDQQGVFANKFVTMMGTRVADDNVVRAGNERVLAARLADAEFFFAEDQKHPLAWFNEKLKGVTFQAKLGDGAKTTHQKVERIVAATQRLCDQLELGARPDGSVAVAAAGLCKADLATGIVGEFPELQGTMGMHYANRTMATELGAHTAAVAAAIEDHYRPKGQGAELPRSVAGAIVALADRMDTLVGCFACGLTPSGSADPLGLRRAAIGVLAILLARETEMPLSLQQLFAAAKTGYTTLDVSNVWTDLGPFFEQRLRGVLADEGLDPVAIDVALGAASAELVPSQIRARAKALAVVPPDVRAAFKRIANILDDARAKQEPIGDVDATAFVADVERGLWQAFNQHAPAAPMARGDYAAGFAALAAMGPQIAAFFDKGGVMVMDPNPVLRKNRLSLLTAIATPFAKVADFRKLQGAS